MNIKQDYYVHYLICCDNSFKLILNFLKLSLLFMGVF